LYSFSLEKIYNTSAENIFKLFRNLTVFRLTGADDIECSFIEGGGFSLTFKNRGVIRGQITGLTENKKIVLNWNVGGFGREQEVNTEVIFTITEENGISTLRLQHNNIKQAESFEAKKRAWGEILEYMENELN